MRGNEYRGGVLERLVAWLVVLVVLGVLLQALIAFVSTYALWIILAFIVLVASAALIRRFLY